MAIKRSEVEKQYTWAIEDLYPSDEAWEQEYKQAEAMLEQFQGYEGKLGDSAEILLSYLQFSDTVNQLFERIYVYANQKLHEDLGNSTYQGLSARAADLAVRLSSAAAFAEPEILAIPEQKLQDFLKGNEPLRLYEKKTAGFAAAKGTCTGWKNRAASGAESECKQCGK